MVFPSGGLVKLPGGNLHWRCSRDFTYNDDAASQLQGLPILRQFLQKQDEAMSLFIEGIMGTSQGNILLDVSDKGHKNFSSNDIVNGFSSMNGHGTQSRALEDSQMQVLQADVPSSKAFSSNTVDFSIDDSKKNLELKGGIGLAKSELSAHLSPHTIYRLEKMSDWWLSLEEPQRISKLATLMSSPVTTVLTALVIISNTIVIALEADHDMRNLNEDDPPVIYTICEWFFVCFYSVEVALNLYVHRLFFFLGEEMYWNIFDLFVVMLSAGSLLAKTAGSDSTAKMGFLRLLRTFKAFRMFRVFSMFRDLRVMLHCIFGSFLSLLWCLLVLLMIILVFAIFFVQALGSYLAENDVAIIEQEAIQDRFGSVTLGILTLYEIVTGMMEGHDIFIMLEPTGLLNCMILLALIGFYQIALINILTGIFVEKATQSGKPERDTEVMEHRLESMQRVAELKDLCYGLKLSRPGLINRKEFLECLTDPNTRFAFEVQGLEIQDAKAFFDLLQAVSNDEFVDIETFVATCMRLRGHASTIDLHYLEFKLLNSIAEVGTLVRSMNSKAKVVEVEDDVAQRLTSLSHIKDIHAAIERLEAKSDTVRHAIAEDASNAVMKEGGTSMPAAPATDSGTQRRFAVIDTLMVVPSTEETAGTPRSSDYGFLIPSTALKQSTCKR